MSRTPNPPRSDQEVIFSRAVAAQLAGLSMDFLSLCEAENLIQPRHGAAGEPGYNAADIRQLARIRRLTEDLGLDLAMVEVVLHLRGQVLGLSQRLQDLERRRSQREEELLAEIGDLRRRLTVIIKPRP